MVRNFVSRHNTVAKQGVIGGAGLKCLFVSFVLRYGFSLYHLHRLQPLCLRLCLARACNSMYGMR